MKKSTGKVAVTFREWLDVPMIIPIFTPQQRAVRKAMAYMQRDIIRNENLKRLRPHEVQAR